MGDSEILRAGLEEEVTQLEQAFTDAGINLIEELEESVRTLFLRLKRRRLQTERTLTTGEIFVVCSGDDCKQFFLTSTGLTHVDDGSVHVVKSSVHDEVFHDENDEDWKIPNSYPIQHDPSRPRVHAAKSISMKSAIKFPAKSISMKSAIKFAKVNKEVKAGMKSAIEKKKDRTVWK